MMSSGQELLAMRPSPVRWAPPTHPLYSTGEARKDDRVCTNGKQARPNTAVFVLFVVEHGGTRGAGK